MEMSTKWIWLLLLLLGFLKFAESTATKWISPIGAYINDTRPPPDKFTFAMIKAGVDEIIAVAADEDDIMDFFDAESVNICPQGATLTNTPLDDHEILEMEYVCPDVCAIKLSSVPTAYVANTAGSITNHGSALTSYAYYMVQDNDIVITIPNRNAAIDSEIGEFALSESDKTVKEIITLCNDPDFNGNLRYLYDTQKILLADFVDKRVKSDWNDIVCLLKMIRNDDKIEYARATVTLQDDSDPTAPFCKFFPVRPDYTGSPAVGMLYYGKQGVTCTITSNPVGMFSQTTEDSCDSTITLASGQVITAETAPSVTVQANDDQSGTCDLPVVVILEPLQCLTTNVAIINVTVHRLQFTLAFQDVILENPLALHGNDTITYNLLSESQTMFEIETSTNQLKIKGSAIASISDGDYLATYVATQDLSSMSVTCTLTTTVVSHGTPCDST